MSHRKILPDATVKISYDIYTIKRLITRRGTSFIYEAFRPYSVDQWKLDGNVENVKRIIIKELARDEDALDIEVSELGKFISRKVELVRLYDEVRGRIDDGFDFMRGHTIFNFRDFIIVGKESSYIFSCDINLILKNPLPLNNMNKIPKKSTKNKKTLNKKV